MFSLKMFFPDHTFVVSTFEMYLGMNEICTVQMQYPHCKDASQVFWPIMLIKA